MTISAQDREHLREAVDLAEEAVEAGDEPFGSVLVDGQGAVRQTARNEAGADSDVDLFFDYERGRLGVYELMDVKEAASRILDRKVDIMTRDSLHRTLRQQIEADAVQVFLWLSARRYQA